MLCFEGKGAIGRVEDSVFAGETRQVAAIGEVDGRLGGEAFEEATGGRVVDFDGLGEFAVGVVEHEGLIVAGGVPWSALRSRPMRLGFLKSKGVFSTEAICPVGTSAAFMGR